jgi:nucleotide-binding universal stress UspA family protein
MARDQRAQVVLVLVIPTEIVRGGMVAGAPTDPNAYRASLTDRLNRLAASAPDVSVEVLLAEGDAPKEILRVAKEKSCDLIVMGSQGRVRPGRLLIGSVAENVVRQSQCPVLILRNPRVQFGESDHGHTEGGPKA